MATHILEEVIGQGVDGGFDFAFIQWDEEAQVELTYNWDPETLEGGRNFGHLAYAVDDIYGLCQKLMDAGITINRPPRDGRMAFVRSPDGISVELLQAGDALPPAEPWKDMPNITPGSIPRRPATTRSTWSGTWLGRV